MTFLDWGEINNFRSKMLSPSINLSKMSISCEISATHISTCRLICGFKFQKLLVVQEYFETNVRLHVIFIRDWPTKKYALDVLSVAHRQPA